MIWGANASPLLEKAKVRELGARKDMLEVYVMDMESKTLLEQTLPLAISESLSQSVRVMSWIVRDSFTKREI